MKGTTEVLTIGLQQVRREALDRLIKSRLIVLRPSLSARGGSRMDSPDEKLIGACHRRRTEKQSCVSASDRGDELDERLDDLGYTLPCARDR